MLALLPEGNFRWWSQKDVDSHKRIFINYYICMIFLMCLPTPNTGFFMSTLRVISRICFRGYEGSFSPCAFWANEHLLDQENLPSHIFNKCLISRFLCPWFHVNMLGKTSSSWGRRKKRSKTLFTALLAMKQFLFGTKAPGYRILYEMIRKLSNLNKK